jgi:hypothetical protein
MPDEVKDQAAVGSIIGAHEFINVKSPLYRSVYSNQTAFGSSAFDFSMTFGELVEVDSEKKRVTVEQQVRVTMSPLHFKIFVATCYTQLKGYEESFGPIHVPEGGGATAVVDGKPVPIPASDSEPKPTKTAKTRAKS